MESPMGFGVNQTLQAKSGEGSFASFEVEVSVESCVIDFANQTKPNQPHPRMILGLGFRVCPG